MPPKDILFNGQSKIVLFDALPSIADDRVVTLATPDGDDVDDSPLLVDEMGCILGEVVSEPIVYDDNNEPITPTMGAPLSFSFDCVAEIKDFMTKPDPDVQEPLICSVSIGEKEYIYRPKNLKYPNKKRAKRIWKKWKRRFGSRPEKCFHLPNALLTTDSNGNYILTTNPK